MVRSSWKSDLYDGDYGGIVAGSVLGHSLPKWDVRATSASPLIATEERTSRNVSNVPTAEVTVAAYSIKLLVPRNGNSRSWNERRRVTLGVLLCGDRR